MGILADVPAGPGKHLRLLSVPLAGGSTVSIPVQVLRGARPGPVLLLTAGEHAMELNGVAAIDRVLRDLAPDEVTGTLLAVPVVNPPAVARLPMGTDGPVAQSLAATDRWNTFRRWPGDRQGTPAERITAALTDAVVRDADAVINFHAWSWYSASCTFGTKARPQAAALAQAFGLTFIGFDLEYSLSVDAAPDPKHCTLTNIAASLGKPALLVELRTQVWLSPESVRLGMQGIRNAMQALGMLAGTPVLPPVQYEFREEELLHAPAAGLFVPVAEIEQSVRQGEVLGYLLGVENGRRRDIVSPCDGVVWLVSRVAAQATGGMEKNMDAFAEPGDLLALIKHVTPLPPWRGR